MPKTTYIWDFASDSYLMEQDGDGNTTAVYTTEPVPYGRVISQRRGDTTSYYHYDGQGSTRQLSDQSGNVTDEYTYSAFGEMVASSGTTENPFRYNGQSGYHHDASANRTYVRARNYSHVISRWLSPDPLDQFSRPTRGYAYVRNSPVLLSDPSGMIPDDDACGQSIPNPQLPCPQRFGTGKESEHLSTFVDCLNKSPRETAKCLAEKAGKKALSESVKLYIAQTMCCELNARYPDPCDCGRKASGGKTGPCTNPLKEPEKFSSERCAVCCDFFDCMIHAVDAMNIKVVPDVLKDIMKGRERFQFRTNCIQACAARAQ